MFIVLVFGGGGFLLYYSANDKKSIVIDFRETAPSNITDEMMQKYIEDDTSTIQGLHAQPRNTTVVTAIIVRYNKNSLHQVAHQ